ncbi:MAG TPA: hypothetical protein VF756_11440 [Thermoanaerobaculia bacterium]
MGPAPPGIALVLAAGGSIVTASPDEARFNRRKPKLSRLLAAPSQLVPEIEEEIARRALQHAPSMPR